MRGTGMDMEGPQFSSMGVDKQYRYLLICITFYLAYVYILQIFVVHHPTEII